MQSNDPTYLKAKKIKDNTKELSPVFNSLSVFLSNEYSVTLLNGDIYFEPVFKNLSPSLRLIIDNEIKETKLPIFHLDRNRISEKFISICNEHNSEIISKVPGLNLRVHYIEFDELFFNEISSKISHSKIIAPLGDPSIVRLIKYFSEYIFFFDDKKTMELKKSNGYQNIIQEKMIELIKKEGYEGKFLSKINIRFDIIDSLNRAGSVYNYLR